MKTVITEEHGSGGPRDPIYEGLSNSDSKDLELEDYLGDRPSYSGSNETSGILSSGQMWNDDSEGFIEVVKKKTTPKKKDGKKNKKEYGSYEKTREEKGRKQEKTVVYEAKKPSNKDGSVAKVIVPSSTTSSQSSKSPTKKLISYDLPVTPVAQTKPIASSGRTKLKLSVNSPSIDIGIIENTRVKGLAREFFDKKFDKDIFDHVTNLTEEANKMMEYRIASFNRIDYCVKKIFTGKFLSIIKIQQFYRSEYTK